MSRLQMLPEPERLRELMSIQAALSIVLCPEEWLRYHRFDPAWSDHVSLAQIDNGAGDHLYMLFSPQGTLFKGFDHESELSPHAQEEYAVWPGIYEQVPDSLGSLLTDEALEQEEVTFCIWREAGEAEWQKGDVDIPAGADDGSDFLLGTIYQTATDFVDFAKGYFEVSLPLGVVTQLYEGAPITTDMISKLNPERVAEEALQAIESLRLIKVDNL